MEILLNFDQTLLHAYEQARDLSRSPLEDWLARYKFKDWKITETSKRKVTEVHRRKRAKEIADKLNNVKMWNSHGLGISMERLRRELNLRVDDFGADPELHGAIRRYHGLMTDFMARLAHRRVVHTRHGYRPLAA